MAKYPEVEQLFEDLMGPHPPKGAQRQLASAVGVTQATISRWVNGEARPGAEHWPSLAHYFNVVVSEIENGVSPPPPTADETSIPELRQSVAALAGGMDELLGLARAQAEILARIAERLPDLQAPHRAAARSRSS